MCSFENKLEDRGNGKSVNGICFLRRGKYAYLKVSMEQECVRGPRQMEAEMGFLRSIEGKTKRERIRNRKLERI
jgi:hypothetical protein